jgi:methionine synthase II (cobalamin-independent)
MANLKTIRTDVVGSLLRPPGLREERIRFDEGELSAEALRAKEDQAIQDAVRLQESLGLDVITDGEIRRINFQDSFGGAVEGFDANRTTIKGNERRVEEPLRVSAGKSGDAQFRYRGFARRPGNERGSRATSHRGDEFVAKLQDAGESR